VFERLQIPGGPNLKQGGGDSFAVFCFAWTRIGDISRYRGDTPTKRLCGASHCSGEASGGAEGGSPTSPFLFCT